MASMASVLAFSAMSMWGFMDCKESLEFLLSDEGKAAIVQLEICLNSEGELVYEDLLKSREVVLLIEDKHSLLIVH